jgi:hypothetical protein
VVHCHGVAVTAAKPNSRTPAHHWKMVVPPDKVAVPPAVHCRAWGGASLHFLAHCRGQVGTALGVAVPPDKGWLCPPEATPKLPPLSLYPVIALGVAMHRTRVGGAPRGSTSSPSSSPLLPLQMCQHYKCFTITCKCVSIFIIIFQRLITSHRLCTRPKMQMQVSNT